MRHAIATSTVLPLPIRTVIAPRIAALRERVARWLSPEALIRAELLAAYAEVRGCMPLFLDPAFDADSLDYAAAMRVDARWRRLARAVINGPEPATADERATHALAMAMDAEGYLDGRRGDSDGEYARAARCLLAATRTRLPPGFTGFGDEDGYASRLAVLEAATPVIPAWARAEPPQA